MRATKTALMLTLAACSRRPPSRPAPVVVAPAATVERADVPARTAPTSLVPSSVGLGAGLRLAAPFHTPSASNPAAVARRPDGFAPTSPPGTRAEVWAAVPGGGRWVTVAPDGSVFVAYHETGTVEVLRDADGDGRAEQRSVFARRLELPLGMAFHPDGWLYVACTNAVVRFRWSPGRVVAEAAPERVAELPGRGYNQHWTRNVAVAPDGRRVFVTVGSETNVEPEDDPRRAAVSVFEPDGRGFRPWATGLRNPLGLAFHPDTGALYTVVNERDLLGDDLVPDYLTAVRDGAFYGWPYAYFGPHEDPRRAGERPDLVARAEVPDLALGAHVAPLGLIFPTREGVGVPRGDALVSLHGSWNRSRPVGYRVVRVRFAEGRPNGVIEDFLGGWLDPSGKAWGRPAGLAEMHDGSVLVADDGAEVLWRVHR